MILTDVNVLIYAHRQDMERHRDYAAWLARQAASATAFGVSEFVLSGFVRVVTNPRVFDAPTPLPEALAFASAVRAVPNAVRVVPGERHWGIFVNLCEAVGARGNRVPDAYLAALAIETGAEFTTSDRGFSRFPGLRWSHPLDV